MCLFAFLTDWEQVEMCHGDERPLSDNQRRVIDVNRYYLTELIDPESIIHPLHMSKCFNERHKEYIERPVTKWEKVNHLLDIVRRRSVASFNKLLDALRTDGQHPVAKLLEEGGGRVLSARYHTIELLVELPELFFTL